jgi:hypothetical protein
MGRKLATVEQRLRALARRQPDFRQRYTLAELGQRYGVTRQRIQQIVGRYDGPRKKPRPAAPRPNALRARLRAFEAEEPGFRDRYTLPELAQKFGVSHQHISKTLGPLGRTPGTVKRARARERLRAFAQQHPQAVRPPHEGGMPMAEMAKTTGVSVRMAAELWRELQLPSRARPSRPRGQVLRRETCLECGRSFPWTVQQEYNFVRGAKRFVVCGVRCGQRQGLKRRLGDPRLIPIADAASHYGMSASQIRRLVQADTVKGKRAGRWWTVDPRSLERHVSRRR